MEAVILELLQATDAENSHALRMEGEQGFRTARGFGQDYKVIWRLEVQSTAPPDFENVRWDLLLDRALEAYEMADPVLTNFDWAHPEMA